MSMCTMIPYKKSLAVNKFYIGQTEDPNYHYKFKLTNKALIAARPYHLEHHNEAWLDVYLAELITKGVIRPILLYEHSKSLMLLLIVPGI